MSQDASFEELMERLHSAMKRRLNKSSSASRTDLSAWRGLG